MIHIEKTEGTLNWWVMKETPEGEQYLHRDGTWHESSGDEGTFSSYDQASETFRRATQQQVARLVTQWKNDLHLRDCGATARLTWKKIKEITLTADQVVLLEQQFNVV